MAPVNSSPGIILQGNCLAIEDAMLPSSGRGIVIAQGLYSWLLGLSKKKRDIFMLYTEQQEPILSRI